MISLAVLAADWVVVLSPGDYAILKFPPLSRHSPRLALQYCRSKELPTKDTRLACSAALLHDIGHAPLSHSLEPVFREVFDLEHHRATEDIITGRIPLGKDLWKTMRKWGVDVERIVAVISGDEPGFDSFFDGPINFDTIEGILRSLSYVKKIPSRLSPETVVQAAFSRANVDDRNTVDEFWACKDLIYSSVINSRAGVLADFTCQLFLRKHLHKFTPNDYFGTERDIFRRLPGLRDLLTSRTFENDLMEQLDRVITYTARRFFVEKAGNFFAREDRLRYKQKRETRTLAPLSQGGFGQIEIDQGLFDDDSL